MEVINLDAPVTDLQKVVVKNNSGKIEPLQMIERHTDELSEYEEVKRDKEYAGSNMSEEPDRETDKPAQIPMENELISMNSESAPSQGYLFEIELDGKSEDSEESGQPNKLQGNFNSFYESDSHAIIDFE